MIFTVFMDTRKKIAFVTARKSYAKRSAEACIKAAIRNETFREFPNMKTMLKAYLLGEGALKIERIETAHDVMPDALYEVLGSLRNKKFKVEFVQPKRTPEERQAIAEEKARIKASNAVKRELKTARAAAELLAS